MWVLSCLTQNPLSSSQSHAYCRDDWRAAVKYALATISSLKAHKSSMDPPPRPTIIHIHAGCFHAMDSPDNRLSCSISLYSSRTEHDLKPWISSQGNIDNILYSRSPVLRPSQRPASSDTSEFSAYVPHQTGLLQELFLQCFICFIKPACAFLYDLTGIQLIFAVPLIHTDTAVNNHGHTFRHTEIQSLSVPGKHHTGNRSSTVLQCKINMPDEWYLQLETSPRT